MPSLRNKRGDNIRIRLATSEDLDALFALDRACFRPGIAYSKTELRYFLFHVRSRSAVAEDESGIAGFAIVEFQVEEGRRIGHIVTIDVAPERRRRGVGRLLMDALFGFCREAEVSELRLEVAVDNDGAIAFYKLLGFAETGRIRGYYLGRLDALVMGLAVQAQRCSPE
ncbi:MAG: GNAT family N-acetyltransferase [Acidobacteriaceae bacterium]